MKALVTLSGGQDSFTCLHWAKKNYDEVETISFDYNQRHKIELALASIVAERAGVKQCIVEIPFLQHLSKSGLVNKEESVTEINDKGLPNSFVPNRNALFLTIAHAYAQQIKADVIVGGMCETDYSGYPDCREVFIENLERTLNLGAETTIKIVTPLMHINKAQTFQLAKDLGVLEDAIFYTNTCYNGVRDINHAWGTGCGECPACKLREAGYKEFVANEE